MELRIVRVLAIAALALHVRADEAHFDATGIVSAVQAASGIYVGVQVGDPVRVRFRVTTPGQIVVPGQLELFHADPASVRVRVGALDVASGTGTPSVMLQNGDAGGPDGVRQFGAQLSDGAVVFLDCSAPDLFTSTDPAANFGSWTPTWASFDCRVAGGGTQIEFTPTTLTIGGGGPGVAYCFGDGSGTACPCGNASAVGDAVGCVNSLALGGKLVATGEASLAADGVVLAGSRMPNSSALYFQGTSQQSGGAGVVFGDGVRCVGGSIVRLGTKANVGGASRYPEAGDRSISARGAITSPGTRRYQCWYRNAASYCTSSTFNLSNGYEIVWQS